MHRFLNSQIRGFRLCKILSLNLLEMRRSIAQLFSLRLMRRFQEPVMRLCPGDFLLPYIEVKTRMRRANKRDAETKEDRQRVNIFLGVNLLGMLWWEWLRRCQGDWRSRGRVRRGAPQMKEDADARKSSIACLARRAASSCCYF